jgi:hypothetical protein
LPGSPAPPVCRCHFRVLPSSVLAYKMKCK